MEFLSQVRAAQATPCRSTGAGERFPGAGSVFRPAHVAPFLMALILLLCLASRLSGEGPPSEYEVKAAFLLNFTKFVTWPADAFDSENEPIFICLLGPDPFGRTLDEMVSGEIVNRRRPEVRRISGVPRPRTCQVLFVSQMNSDVPKILKQIGPGVLTVGEGTDFLDAGGIIGFTIENHRVRFDINRTAAAAFRLQLSSQLLNVARSVR